MLLVVFELRFAKLARAFEGLAGLLGAVSEPQKVLPEQEITAAEIAIGLLRSAHERDVFLQGIDGKLKAACGGVGFAQIKIGRGAIRAQARGVEKSRFGGAIVAEAGGADAEKNQ